MQQFLVLYLNTVDMYVSQLSDNLNEIQQLAHGL